MNLVIKYKYCSGCKKKRFIWQRSYKKYVIAKTGGTMYYCFRCNFKIRKNLNAKKQLY